MKLRKVFKKFLTLSLLAGTVAQGSLAQAEHYPGGGGGPQAPGPQYPDPQYPDRRQPRGPGNSDPRGPDCDYYNRGPYRDPRCEDGRGGPRDDHWGNGRNGRDGRRGPRHPHPQPPPQYPPQYPPQNPPYGGYNPSPAQGESSLIFSMVAPRPGGEWLRVHVLQPLRLDYVQVQVLNGAVALHEAVVLTRSGGRYYIRDLSRVGVLHSFRSSEFLSIHDQVVAIDLRAESVGYPANLLVRVIGSHSVTLSGSRF